PVANRDLIIGGGMTGDAAAKAIRERDPDGSIVLVGDEQHAPDARPPLSKALWKGKEEESIWRKTDEHGVDLRLDRRIVALDPDAHTATHDHRETYEYHPPPTRPTTRARRPSTPARSSRPAGSRRRCRTLPAASSTSGRSTTTTACAS